MALIWQKQVTHAGKTTQYEVRNAGRTRRLYTNGVFHSQYSPSRPVAGSVWDLLLLPAFFHRPGLINRVLVLGVGGGAVLKQLQYFLQPEVIVGVELNPVHIQVAKRFFKVTGDEFELVCADALEWLEQYQGPPFDLIIDDLFGEEGGEPCRAVAADEAWCALLKKHLMDSGSVAINFDTPELMQRCFWLAEHAADPKALSKKSPATNDHLPADWWQQVYQLSTPLYSNCIALFTQQPTPRHEFLENLRQFKELDESRTTCKLNYQLRRVR
ncbi:class I SAM-dependent methyltransferase [Aestuariicella hydrocarbonica]|uniref:Class I SAM-dependent methyltransferase n=1 Tax=Pseudomaricurvus hydrocarbonicus TaxID=1470433 RepID=A0A9E5JRF6_9GAMM|nr:class I SAM-dependent methyltransferase [Aestuariicella hydrocarbonica]NHO65397.1 class I SAM-dependent methyltransferase [Aestuariicella hydrocarbonica]